MNRLQQIADRPIGEGERRGAFLAAASILIVAAAILLVMPSGQREVDGPESAAIASWERIVARPSIRTESNKDAPELAARRFLSSYLRFVYGQGDSRSIVSVTPSLFAKLAESRGRVSPAAKTRDPRVVEIVVRNVAPDRAAATATVEVDGVSFPITMRLGVRDGRWLVDSVGAD